jgi:hypothetical protein
MARLPENLPPFILMQTTSPVIPPEVGEKIAHLLPHEIHLQCCQNSFWPVTIESSRGQVRFTKGWRIFKRAHEIPPDAIITFAPDFGGRFLKFQIYNAAGVAQEPFGPLPQDQSDSD